MSDVCLGHSGSRGVSSQEKLKAVAPAGPEEPRGMCSGWTGGSSTHRAETPQDCIRQLDFPGRLVLRLDPEGTKAPTRGVPATFAS